MCWQREMLETVSLGHGYICCWYRSLMHLAWYSTSLWLYMVLYLMVIYGAALIITVSLLNGTNANACVLTLL